MNGKRLSSHGSLDGVSTNTLSMDVPDVRTCREARERSRKDMHELNEKLATQLDRMRMVSETNRKLKEESDGSRGRHAKEMENMRQTYDKEIRQLRQLVDENEREKADSLVELTSLQQAARSLQDQINNLEKSNRNMSNQLDAALKSNSVKDVEREAMDRYLRSARDEIEALRAENDEIKQANKQIIKDLNEETANRMTCQSEMQTLREEMNFVRTVHEQEMEELRALSQKEHESDLGRWREDVKRAIRDIQNEYDARLDKIRSEMDENFSNKVNELNKNLAQQEAKIKKLSEDNSSLKKQLDTSRSREEHIREVCDDLERKLNATLEENQNLQLRLDEKTREAQADKRAAEEALGRTLQELSSLTDAKLNLETEVAAYRRLLEVQDNLMESPKESQTRKGSANTPRGSTAKELRVRVPSYMTTSEYNSSIRSDSTKRWIDRDDPSGQSIRSNYMEPYEGSQQVSTTFTGSDRSASGKPADRKRVSISSCAKNGTYIELTNTGEEDVSLSGWILTRKINHDKQLIQYTFPDRVIPANATLRVWGLSRMGHDAGPYDFESPYPSWGTGNVIHTSLRSADGVEVHENYSRG